MPQEFIWYVVRGKEQAGPLTNDQLRAYAERGDLKPEDQVWRAGFDSWRKAGDIPGLLRPPAIPKNEVPLPPPPPPAERASATSSQPPSVPQTTITDTTPGSGLVGVRGWLLLLCIQLIIISPLLTIVGIFGLFQQLRPSFRIVEGLGGYFAFVVGVTVVVLIASILVGVLLWSRRKEAPSFARWFLLSAFAWLCFSPYTIYFFVRMPPGAVPGILRAALPEIVLGAITTVAWYFYLLKSKRVQKTFGLTSGGDGAAPAGLSADSKTAKEPHADIMSTLKVAGVLVAVSALCVLFLAFTTSAFDLAPSELGVNHPLALELGKAIGAGILLIVISAIGATIGNLATRKAARNERQSGTIIGGVIAALLFTGLYWLGANAERLVATHSTKTSPLATQSSKGRSADTNVSGDESFECVAKPVSIDPERDFVLEGWLRRQQGCPDMLGSEPSRNAIIQRWRREAEAWHVARQGRLAPTRQDLREPLPQGPAPNLGRGHGSIVRAQPRNNKRCVAANPQKGLSKSNTQKWRRVALPEGIAFEIPGNWIVADHQIQEVINTLGRFLAAKSAIEGRMGFGASLYASDGRIVAQMGIRFYVNGAANDIYQANIESATWAEIQYIDKELRNGLELSLSKPSYWQGTRRARAGEFTSLLSVYAVRFTHEKFDRCFIRARVYDGKLSFSALFNYDESIGSELRPTIDRIINSLASAER